MKTIDLLFSKPHKPHIVSTDKRTDRRTVRLYYAPNFIWGHNKKYNQSNHQQKLILNVIQYVTHIRILIHTIYMGHLKGPKWKHFLFIILEHEIMLSFSVRL